MRLVKTPEEIRKIQGLFARNQHISTRNLVVTFETTPDAIRALLPPPLEPMPEPLGSAWVGEVANSNSVGPFVGAALYLRARFGDIVGNYCLTMPVSTPQAVTFGRELYGQPAKLARMIFERQDEFVWGSAERHEIRFLSLRGRLTGQAATGRQVTSTFHFKFSPRADGVGFDGAPLLIHETGESTVEKAERGRGELIFRDSPHDPVSDIPVTQVVDAVYTEGHTYTSARVLTEVDPEAFLPYSFGKTDAFDVVTEGTLMHVQAARRSRAGKGQWRNN
ncbi:MAG TPA: acetoacetate decarboxylase family protein [Dehalococcoidia bacterium]|nr:acetoacetate decarboxylase family protein [Dehalococcoidia bacterium]